MKISKLYFFRALIAKKDWHNWHQCHLSINFQNDIQCKKLWFFWQSSFLMILSRNSDAVYHRCFLDSIRLTTPIFMQFAMLKCSTCGKYFNTVVWISTLREQFLDYFLLCCLEQRQNKNDSIQSKILPILKLPLFSPHCIGGEKARQFQNCFFLQNEFVLILS